MRGAFVFGDITVDVEDLANGDVKATIIVVGDEPLRLLRSARPEGYSLRAAAAEALLHLLLLAAEDPEITAASIKAQTKGMDEASRTKAHEAWQTALRFANRHADRIMYAAAPIKKYFQSSPGEAVRISRGHDPGDLVFYWDAEGHPIGLDLFRDYLKSGGRRLRPGEEIYNVRRLT